MALRVNSSSASSVTGDIISAMASLDSQFPDGEWLASLITSQHHEEWELKLSKDGISRRRSLFAEQQNSGAVCANLLELREMWSKESTDPF